jgi:hypothetical protein
MKVRRLHKAAFSPIMNIFYPLDSLLFPTLINLSPFIYGVSLSADTVRILSITGMDRIRLIDFIIYRI